MLLIYQIHQMFFPLNFLAGINNLFNKEYTNHNDTLHHCFIPTG